MGYGKDFISPITGLPYYMSNSVYRQLLRAKKRVLKGKSDRVIIIDGREGTGKSTLTMQLAYAVDPTFNINRICFKWEEFYKKGRALGKGKAILFDEAHDGLSSKSALSKQNKQLVQFLMEVRQRNLFIFIVLPSIFLLEKYVAIFRSQVLFHTYIGVKNYDKRFYKIYSYNKKKLLYLFGKNFMDYSKPKIPKSYRFYSKLPPSIKREEYDKLKLGAFKDSNTGEQKLGRWDTQTKRKWLVALDLLINRFKMKQTEVSKELTARGVPISNVSICFDIKNATKNFKLKGL